MTAINEYLKTLTGIRKERVGAVVAYIRGKYPTAVEGMYCAPHTQMPTFELGKHRSIGLGSTKSYISLYFSNFNAPRIFAAANPKIKTGKCCINIRDGMDFPMEDIRRAIDFCFD